MMGLLGGQERVRPFSVWLQRRLQLTAWGRVMKLV